MIIGGGDGPLAALGAGVLTSGDSAYTYLGSSSWISMSARRPLYDPAMRAMTFNHVVPGHYVPTATMQAGGASLEWIAQVLRPDGVAFNLATCVTAFREAGHPVDRVDAIGGDAASDTWLRILADVWGAHIRRRGIVEEANSLGAAVTAAVGSGLVDGFEVARELSQVEAEFAPSPDRHRDYTTRHREFLDAYRGLEPWFARGRA